MEKKFGRFCFIPLGGTLNTEVEKNATDYADKQQNNLCLSV